MLKEKDVTRLVVSVWDRFAKMRERQEKRNAAWHRLPIAAPIFPDDSGIENDYQTHLLTSTHRALKSRLTENHFVISAEPLKKTQGNSAKAETLEKVLNPGFQIIEERLGHTLQSGLSDGQIKLSHGVIGCRRADETWPAVPEWEYLDDIPDPNEAGIDEAVRKDRQELRARFEDDEYDDEDTGEKKKRYKETGASYLERVKEQRAKAGFPYWVGTYDPRSVAWTGDEAGGLALVVTMQKIPLIKYREQQEGQKYDNKPIQIALSEQDSKLRVYREVGDNPIDSDGTSQFTKSVTVACLWTRDEWHEIAALGDVPPSGGDENWQYVKGGKHTYGEPPFAIVPATEDTTELLPEYRYLPALHDVYDLKPGYDKAIALLLALGERMVIKDVFLKNVKGLPGLIEDGSPVEIGTSSKSAEELPPGYELDSLGHELNPAFIQGVSFLAEQIRDAIPETGVVQLEGGTQPWTARQMAEQANVYPRQLLQSQLLGIQKIVRIVVQDMSTRDDTVVVFSKGEDIVGIEPKDITGLKVDVKIETTSSSERVTKEEHYRNLVNDPLIRLPLERYWEDGAGVPDPIDRVVETEAVDFFTKNILPQKLKQEAAKRYGFDVVIGPGMQFVGMGGEQVSSQRILQQADQPQSTGVNTRIAPGAQPQQTIPPMQDNPAPGQVARPPLVAV